MSNSENEYYEYFLKIAELQHHDGYFTLDHHFATTLGLNYAEIKIEAQNRHFDEDVWATILAMSFFIRRFKALKAQWQPIIAKCNDWLVQASECCVTQQENMFSVALNKYIKE